jgi:phenylalanyl-tRNA synthetase alpha chain
MKRFLDMPDLSRTAGSPIHAIVKRILALPDFKDFSIITSPEIIPADISFDLFNFPKDHPARKKSDTYFPDDNHVLRTHTTVMWYYHLNNPTVKEKIKKGLPVGALSYGKVYRRDEIDRHHMNIFHQMDGWYLCQKKEKIIGLEDLKDVLVKIANAVYGKDMEDYRFNKDEFPYTDPSLEMEIKLGGKWIEVLGSGVVRAVVLDNLGVDSKIYNGWAFGFGLERLAILSMNLPDIRLLWSNDERVKKQLHLGQNFKEVSKYPPITRDISFIVGSNFVPNDYYDLIRDLGGDLVEEVKLLDTYKDPKKFGAGKISYTYRIIYRSNERTLKASEVDAIQDKIYSQTVKKFKAQLR